MTKPKRPSTAEAEFGAIWDEIADKPDHFRWLWLLTMDHAVPDRLVRAALAIWLHRNSKTGQAFPSQGRLARMLHTTPRTFRRYSDGLVQLGLIASEEGGRGKQTKRYELRDRVQDPAELFDLQYDLETILRAKGQAIRAREVGGPSGRTATRPLRADGNPSSNIRREQERFQDHVSVGIGTTAREAVDLGSIAARVVAALEAFLAGQGDAMPAHLIEPAALDELVTLCMFHDEAAIRAVACTARGAFRSWAALGETLNQSGRRGHNGTMAVST